jgi:ribosome biogenesis protein ENP2
MEVSWVPSASSARDANDVDAGSGSGKSKSKSRKGVQEFGAGLEKGYRGDDSQVSEQDRKGRTQRRKGVRSGSKNVFRRMDA